MQRPFSVHELLPLLFKRFSTTKHCSVMSQVILTLTLIYYNIKVCFVFSLESPRLGDSIEYTQYTIFKYKKENHPILSEICSHGKFFYFVFLAESWPNG